LWYDKWKVVSVLVHYTMKTYVWDTCKICEHKHKKGKNMTFVNTILHRQSRHQPRTKLPKVPFSDKIPNNFSSGSKYFMTTACTSSRWLNRHEPS